MAMENSHRNRSSPTSQHDPQPALSQSSLGTSGAVLIEPISSTTTTTQTPIPLQESSRYASATLPPFLPRRDPVENTTTRHGAESSSSYTFALQPLPMVGFSPDRQLLAPPSIPSTQPPPVAPPVPAVVSSSRRTTDANRGSISSEATHTQPLRPNTQTSNVSGASTHLLHDFRRVSVGPFHDEAGPTRRTSTIPVSMRSGTGTEIDWIVPAGEKVRRIPVYPLKRQVST
jgi:hypothetical protein